MDKGKSGKKGRQEKSGQATPVISRFKQGG
jgi:hypothetical protein